ncbi:MAG: HEAT repeat domain-containing protein [Ignavibacteriales bacterium]|nr:HEAT repeat domain-containing protein [Ignavibacteriales bacterium]
MEHEKYKEWIDLSLYNELTEEESRELNKHIVSCTDCKSEFEKVEKLRLVLNGLKTTEPGEQLLSDARRELRSNIQIEQSKKSLWEISIERLNQFLSSNIRVAMSGAVMVLVGIGIGYLLFTKSDVIDTSQFINASQTDPFERNDIKIRNLQFNNSPSGNNEVSFSFEAVKSVKMKGKIGDELIQKVLAHSLVNEQNDGVRLRTLNAISAQTENKKKPDAKVKVALISALKFDSNAGVRREALVVLKKFPVDEDIIEALLFVLKNDKNSGLRVAAINSLSDDKISEKNLSKEMLELLQQRSREDENQYVRIRAKSILQEVVQQ